MFNAPVRLRLALLLLAITTVTAPASAQPQKLSADEKELASYRLTMPTIKKVMAAMQTIALEMTQDPRYKEQQKLDAMIEALEEKEELTPAEEQELEKLRERQANVEAEFERATGAQGDVKTLSDMEAQVKRQPGAVRALAREGITPREYALCMTALLQAAMVEGFSQGKADLANLPAGINPENVRFVRENKAALEAMQKAMNAPKK